MGLEDGEPERGYVRAVGPSRTIPLFRCPVSKAKTHVIVHTIRKGILGAASLETYSENPADWKCCMRASMHADVT